jgi:hypothetical protein
VRLDGSGARNCDHCCSVFCFQARHASILTRGSVARFIAGTSEGLSAPEAYSIDLARPLAP